jgi:4-amino-4-deoxy-L-arabinose transferase-like glycosyltransferase
MLKRRLVLSVLALTIGALVLRLWGVGFGLPQAYHIDEHFYYPSAWSLGQGQLTLPDQSHGPSLYLGLLLIGQKSMQAIFFPQLSNAAFGALRTTNPWPYLLSARIISALLGALTIPIVFLLARRFRDYRLGLIAAAIMTVLFFHVRDSHFGVPDTLTTLFAAATVWLSLRAYQTRRSRDVLFAGMAAGLAAGAKYTTVVAAVAVIVAALLMGTSWRQRLNLLLVAALGMLAGFIIGYPNLLLNPAIFIKDISFLFARVGEGFEGWRIMPDNSAIFYLDTLLWSTGLAAVILTGMGLIAAIVRHRAEDWILISFPIVYFVVMSLSQGHFGRYMLPILPITTVLIVDAAWHVLPQIIRRWRNPIALKLAQPIGLVALLLVFVPNLLNSLRLDWVLSQPDTRTIAKQWIESHLPAGTRIAIEWPYHTPPLSNGYQVPPESTRDYWTDLVYGFGLADRPIKQYQTDGTQYIIATSYIRDIPVIDPQQEARRQQFYAQLPQVFSTVQTFSPRCDGGDPAFIFDSVYGPAIDLWNLCYAGPEITIYQVRRP